MQLMQAELIFHWPHCCYSVGCWCAGEEEDFAQKYLQAFLSGDGEHGCSKLQTHERCEMASAVTPVSSSAFVLLRQAILETLAKGRVSGAPSLVLVLECLSPP